MQSPLSGTFPSVEQTMVASIFQFIVYVKIIVKTIKQHDFEALGNNISIRLIFFLQSLDKMKLGHCDEKVIKNYCRHLTA